jgi:diacylglycerol O-acyltransferase
MASDPSEPAATVGGVPERQARVVRTDRRMSDVEAMMWTIEKDPFLSSTFGTVTLLDRPPDFDRFRRRMLQTASRIPQLRQRVQPGLGRLAPPEWQDDPDFDIDYHVRRQALAPPGTDRQLFDLAAQMVHQTLDRTRPLWEFVIVEGLEGGRAALVQKMHHTITDGEGGVRMSEQFIDVAADAPDVAEVAVVVDPGLPPANVFETGVDALSHTVRRSLGAGQRAASGMWSLACHPSRLGDAGGDAVETLRSAVRQVTVTDHAHSPLWDHRSLRRHLEVLDVDFDDAYRAAKALGGSLNDIFVTGTARGAGLYHQRRGVPVETLRMAMPVSTRRDHSAAGNSFVPTRVVLPVDVDGPEVQFRAIHGLLEVTKHERAASLVGTLAGLLNVLPTAVLVRFARQQVETVDFTTSNVRAAPFDLYIAGAHIEATYPLGPLAGTAFNLTMMSYRGQLNMGLHVDLAAIDDPDLLRTCLLDGFAEVIAAAG